MKKSKSNLFLNLVLLVAAIFTVLVVYRQIEGFQTGNVVTLYFTLDANNVPKLISLPTNAGITQVMPATNSAASAGTAIITIPSTLGNLKSYTGSGHSTPSGKPVGNWLPYLGSVCQPGTTCASPTPYSTCPTGTVCPNGAKTCLCFTQAKLDKGAGTLFLTLGGKTIHNPLYSKPVGKNEIKLASAGLPTATGATTTQITINNLTPGTLGFLGAGDPSIKDGNANAKVRIQLTF